MPTLTHISLHAHRPLFLAGRVQKSVAMERERGTSPLKRTELNAVGLKVQHIRAARGKV